MHTEECVQHDNVNLLYINLELQLPPVRRITSASSKCTHPFDAAGMYLVEHYLRVRQHHFVDRTVASCNILKLCKEAERLSHPVKCTGGSSQALAEMLAAARAEIVLE